MMTVSDVDVAAMQVCLGRKVGPSTGANFVGMLTRPARCANVANKAPSVRDAAERYLGSYFDDPWVAQHMGEPRSAHGCRHTSTATHEFQCVWLSLKRHRGGRGPWRRPPSAAPDAGSALVTA